MFEIIAKKYEYNSNEGQKYVEVEVKYESGITSVILITEEEFELQSKFQELVEDKILTKEQRKEVFSLIEKFASMKYNEGNYDGYEEAKNENGDV